MGVLNDYKIYFPERGIFISGNHNWAFAAWELSKMYGETQNATLIHVDGHLDDTWDGVEVEGLHDIKNQADVYKVAESLQIDNFIWAAFSTDAINNVIYVTRKTNRFQSHDPFDFSEWDLESKEFENLKTQMNRKPYKGERFETIEELALNFRNSNLSNYFINKKIILDLDLDYFNLSDDLLEPNIMSDKLIRDNLLSLREMYDWDLITVALSPTFCGNDYLCWRIYEIFLEVFSLDLKEAEIW